MARDATVPDTASCEALAIVQAKCATCHAEEPVDAPVTLISAEDFQVDAMADDTQKTFELALARIRDEDAPMPPVDAEALSTAERRVLTRWLEGGARPASTDCEAPEQEDE